MNSTQLANRILDEDPALEVVINSANQKNMGVLAVYRGPHGTLQIEVGLKQ